MLSVTIAINNLNLSNFKENNMQSTPPVSSSTAAANNASMEQRHQNESPAAAAAAATYAGSVTQSAPYGTSTATAPASAASDKSRLLSEYRAQVSTLNIQLETLIESMQASHCVISTLESLLKSCNDENPRKQQHLVQQLADGHTQLIQSQTNIAVFQRKVEQLTPFYMNPGSLLESNPDYPYVKKLLLANRMTQEQIALLASPPPLDDGHSKEPYNQATFAAHEIYASHLLSYDREIVQHKTVEEKTKFNNSILTTTRAMLPPEPTNREAITTICEQKTAEIATILTEYHTTVTKIVALHTVHKNSRYAAEDATEAARQLAETTRFQGVLQMVTQTENLCTAIMDAARSETFGERMGMGKPAALTLPLLPHLDNVRALQRNLPAGIFDLYLNATIKQLEQAKICLTTAGFPHAAATTKLKIDFLKLFLPAQA